MTEVQTAPAPEASEAPENFPLAIAAGLIVAIVGAGLWAAITVATKFQIGIMAVALGYAVGQGIRAVGHGRTQKFGILGAVCALIGCMLGNLLSAVMIFADQAHVPFMTVLFDSNLNFLFSLMKDFFQVLDLLFYGIAIYEGYRFSFHT
jgi:hypothetical protein